MPIIGTPVRRVEDQRLLTVGGEYVADLVLEGVLEAVYVLSSEAHARVTGIALDDARGAPGVVAVFDASDIDIGPMAPVHPAASPEFSRPLLARDRVRFVGEPLAVVVAETRNAAEDAAELVEIGYEPLDVVVGVEASARNDSLLFPDAGSNLVGGATGGTATSAPDEHDVVVRATFVNQRVAPCPMETRAGAARWEAGGRLTHWSSCQGGHPVRTLLAGLYGIDADQIRVIVPEVGGSFGSKARPSPEELLLGWLARRLGRPVRWVPDRSRDMVGLGHSRAQRQHVEIGGTRDGVIHSVAARVEADAGAYPAGPPLANNTGALLPGVYHVPSVTWTTEFYVTNTTPIVAYRGAGRPEAAALIERGVDRFAAEIGMDPVEVRRRNFVRADEQPYTTPTGVVYDGGDYGAAMEQALAVVDYAAVRREQAARRSRGDRELLGVGIATFLDRTAGVPGTEYGSVELLPDGHVRVHTGSTPYGQGHHTAWAMLVADRTGVPIERIVVVHGDTDAVPRGAVTGGSRSAQRAGSAVVEATDALVELGRELAARELEASVDDIALDTEHGQFHVRGVPARSVSWADVAASTADRALRCESDFEGDGPTVPFGAYVVVVEVDVETGKVSLRRVVTVDDAGTILNPMLALGQVHGGVVQGLAQGLWEEFVYDDAGNPLTTTFLDYMIPSAADLPSFECALTETPSPNNPLGFKGIAESGTIGATPAVQNAVVDAVAHLGVEHIDLPLTPERVWRAIRAARRG
jgi:carbon-monoxide dehydrogenase large subunit